MKTSFTAHLKESLRLGLYCLIEWLLFLPVWIILQHYLQPEPFGLAWMYTLPLLSLTGMLLRHMFNRKWKQLLAALLIGMAAALLTFTTKPELLNLPLAVFSVAFPYLGMTVVNRKNRNGLYISGLAVYFIATIAFAPVPELKPSIPMLSWSGSLCLVLALLDTNTSFLRYSSFSDESTRLPAGLRRHNRMFVILFIVAAAALAAGAGKAIGLFLWNSVRTIIGWILSLFSGAEEPLSPVRESGGAPQFLSAQDQEPGLLGIILEVFFYALLAAVVIFLLYVVLRWLYRNTGGVLRRVLDRLMSMLRRGVPEEQSAYQDEEESIFAWEKTLQGIRHYWRDKLSPHGRRDRWEGMNGSRERTRWLYRQWLREKRAEGYEAKGFLTPQETAADVSAWSEGRKRQRKSDIHDPSANDRLLRLYNQARYGEEEPSASEVSSLKERLKM